MTALKDKSAESAATAAGRETHGHGPDHSSDMTPDVGMTIACSTPTIAGAPPSSVRLGHVLCTMYLVQYGGTFKIPHKDCACFTLTRLKFKLRQCVVW